LHAGLEGDVSGGPCVAVAKAEEQVDIGRPRTDARQRGQYTVRFIGADVTQGFKVETLGLDLAGEVKERLCFGA
jgi:hypothetical protein